MNLLDKKWVNRDKLNLEYKDKKIIIENNSDTHKFLIYPQVFKATKSKEISINFEGNVIYGNGCVLKILNRNKTIIGECSVNSFFQNKYDFLKYYIVVIYVNPKSKIEITALNYENNISLEYFKDYLNSETLVITPGYPSLFNKYNTAFVHTRVLAYKESGFNTDVVVCNYTCGIKRYEFEGVNVLECNYYYLREILKQKIYKRILIHFFDNNFANILETIDTSETQLYFYLHGAETLYRDWPKIASHYFETPVAISQDLENLFRVKDYYIKKYNNIKNAKWIFVTDWTKQRCEELLDIKFNNSEIIPCLIDTNTFCFKKKDPELRKKIFVLRKFDNISSYSLDLVVRVILELSHREFFDDLQFDIYGDGALHEEILAPIKEFKNVNIERRFLSHDEIKKVHDTHGIALFPTRFDSQAVSSCEAASSGCAVITSDIPGVRQFIPSDLGVMCEVENYIEYANVIEKMYKEPEYFLNVGEKESQSVQSKFDYNHTIAKELELFESEPINKEFSIKPVEQPLLSVIIPSYNVESFLRHTVFSLIDQRNANKLEVIIVNDGSKDKTKEIALELINKYCYNNSSIIKLLDKPNGGHGSTINEGIKMASGKYIKIVDGDDTVDSEEFAKLIDVLENETSDIILNNYMEDFAQTNNLITNKIYSNLSPGVQYKFDDLCYDNYGFSTWGPILSCSTYKSSMLKNGKFSLSEKMFYVDMELNINVAILCETITYYDLNVYRYLLGREGQSVNRESYKKHYKDHENVCINMIETYYKNIDRISKSKKNYIENHLIQPMLSTQYEICINYYNNSRPFREFNKRLKKYQYFYKNDKIKIKKVKFHRITHGHFIFLNDFIVKLKSFLNK